MFAELATERAEQPPQPAWRSNKKPELQSLVPPPTPSCLPLPSPPSSAEAGQRRGARVPSAGHGQAPTPRE